MTKSAPIEIKIEQRTDEWLAFREGKIGASQAAAIMNKSPFSTRLQEWEKMMYGHKTKMNPAMERGIKYEPEALEWFNRKQGNENFEPAVFRSGFNPSIIASLDGWNGKISLEIKIPGKFSLEVPNHYNIQMQHQMMVMNTKQSWYCEYSPDMKQGWSCMIPRDDVLIEEMVREEHAFLASLVDLNPPEPCDRDWVEEVDSTQCMRLKKYRANAILLSDMEKRQKTLRDEIIAQTKHMRTRFDGMSIQKVIRKGNVDYAKLIEEYKIIDSERFRGKAIESWRIS